MAPPLARVPAGVQSLFGGEARLRRAVERRLLETFAGWSYEELLLPVFDYAELFEGGLGHGRARLYRFTDHQGDLLALRPELTTLVARTVATRLREAPLPLRLSYSGEVFRFDPPRRGRQAEFHQVGLEHLGTDRLEADLEVLLVCVEALRAVGLSGFRLALGHVGFLSGIADALGLEAPAREALRGALDRRDPEAIAAALDGRAEPPRVQELARLATLSGGAEVLADALALVKNPVSRAAADELQRVLATARAAGLDQALAVDLGSVAGFDYYTGMTFQVFVPGLAAPLGGGGRYDRLMSQFGHDLPAVGFSLCLDWLCEAVERSGQAARLAPAARPEPLTGRDGAGGDLAGLFRRAASLRQAGRVVRIEAP